MQILNDRKPIPEVLCRKRKIYLGITVVYKQRISWKILDSNCFYTNSPNFPIGLISYYKNKNYLIFFNFYYDNNNDCGYIIQTFLLNPFFLLVIKSMSSNKTTKTSWAFPESNICNWPSIIICLLGLTIILSQGCLCNAGWKNSKSINIATIDIVTI